MIRRLFLLMLLASPLSAQVSFDRLLNADKEPQNWLTYSGTMMSQRYSTLNQVAPQNVKNLELKWVFQAHSLEKFEATPLVVDGVMYTVQPPNDIVALDPVTGRVFWIYAYAPSPKVRPCCGRVNRGVAIAGDTLFMGTLDDHVIAVDAKSGRPIWNTTVARPESGYAITHAPLVIKDKVLVGVAGAEFGIRGFIAAFDVKTGKEVWRFYTVPGPGEPGNETWAGDSWKTGGGSVWLTGSYDPALNLTYWGIGNPGADYNGDKRSGDNLYTSSVVALDADTGKIKWHYQFSPHNEFDFDAVQIPVLADINWQGRPRSVMLWANRNGFFYVLDRATGQFLLGKPFVDVNWAEGFDEKGRPMAIPGKVPTPEGTVIFPGNSGGTNWYSPSFSPRTSLFYIPSWVNYSSVYTKAEADYEEGKRFVGAPPRTLIGATQGARINTRTEDEGYGAIRAIDPHTGERKWEFKMNDVTTAGILTTASDLLFSGGREGHFYALNARNGDLLWKVNLGGDVVSGPMSYAVGGKQYIAISAGSALFVYGLRE